MSIPLHIVCGLFGSGKTTFLKNYMQQFGAQKRIGIIQNEFSPVGIDTKELYIQNGEYKILEINNGSVFCVCLLGSFIPSLKQFIQDTQTDELIMEASGMSDPLGITQILQSKALKEKVHAGYYWTVIDAFNFKRDTVLRNRLELQIRIADVLILNKTDLVSEDEIAEIKGKLKALNPFAKTEETTFCDIKISAEKKAFDFLAVSENKPSTRPNIATTVLKSHLRISLTNLKQFLHDVSQEAMRYKGFVLLENNKSVLIHGVFEHYEIQEINSAFTQTELIIIGSSEKSQALENKFKELSKT